MLDNLAAELRKEIASGGTRPMQTPTDVLRHEHAITRQETGKAQMLLRALIAQLQADSVAVTLPVDLGLERSQSANIVRLSANTPIYGIGTNDYPDYLVTTNLTQNPDGSFEP